MTTTAGFKRTNEGAGVVSYRTPTWKTMFFSQNKLNAQDESVYDKMDKELNSCSAERFQVVEYNDQGPWVELRVSILGIHE